MSEIDQQIATEIVADAAAVAERVSDIILARVRAQPRLTLGLATGRTMVPIYQRLVAAYRAGTVSFRGCTTFNLDEYCGLAAHDPASFHTYMRASFFDHVDLRADHAHVPDGMAADADGESLRYERLIAAAGGIDLQVLGIGINGHIGFNEPGSPLRSRTCRVTLAPETRAANSFSFGEGRAVPSHAITMGIATILDAREIVLVATGRDKKRAVEAALNGPVSEDCPASALRRHHHACLVCDEDVLVR
ncbi:glucosamine-6-phosphate deaminase [Limobrevibacterium gyesilva]|uniref:Glucosamine-6-phosphate deaminase n=1 Tax=Limobrevibacterium gyesilva TaxID=2991712 RepID=A0AA41YJQ3_9PROT|nr:glucosamine-6-phosphate deaminase [Limobrevibacterium gyesilva]MCW3475004.1 glucosamine-6-phosphate deaminase [Limobrevibacterium gyesilva]